MKRLLHFVLVEGGYKEEAEGTCLMEAYSGRYGLGTTSIARTALISRAGRQHCSLLVGVLQCTVTSRTL